MRESNLDVSPTSNPQKYVEQRLAMYKVFGASILFRLEVQVPQGSKDANNLISYYLGPRTPLFGSLDA